MKKFVDAELSQEDFEKVMSHIEAINTLLPFLINLTIQQRIRLPKMNHRRKPFVEKTLYYAKANPSFIPSYIDIEAMKRNLDLYNKLTKIEEQINILKEKISDTIIGCGSDCFDTGLAIYKAYQIAGDSDVPGIDSALKDLGKFFKRGKYKKDQREDSSFEDDNQKMNEQ